MGSQTLPHDAAVDAFVDRVEEIDPPGVEEIVLFGSVARGSHTSDSDVDVLVVVAEGTDEADLADELRAVAYDVMLEYGAVFSIQTVASPRLRQRSDHPFFTRVFDEGRSIYG